MFARLVVWCALVFGVVGLAFGCSGGVVGGECRDGYSVCEGRCIALKTSTDHCGACGNVCPASQACVSGVCRPSGAGGTDAATDGGTGGRGGSGGSGGVDAGGDSSVGNGGDGSIGGDGSAGDANGSGGRNVGGQSGTGGRVHFPDGGDPDIAPDGAVCTGPYDTPTNCGRCGLVCPPDKPLCEHGEGYNCVELCTLPLTDCGGSCVNLQTDEFNCGRCGVRCPSGICQGGMCVGAVAGHEVLVCSDYRQQPPSGSADERLLGNAAFLTARPQVRILGYTEFAQASVVQSVKNTLTSLATQRGRTFTLAAAKTSADVVNNLDVTDYDVLLVFDQSLAPAGRLATVGAGWTTHLTPFVRAGGIVIVLAGPLGRGEMGALLTASEMLTVTGQTDVTDSQIHNRAPGDVIGLNVVTPFRALRETCTFTTGAPDALSTFVITDKPSTSGDLGNPVLVHRVIAP